MSQVERMVEAQTTFQEAHMTLQTKTDMQILKMKANDLEGENMDTSEQGVDFFLIFFIYISMFFYVAFFLINVIFLI